jgi:glycosyltransferase involved in cell wall biosynthesis
MGELSVVMITPPHFDLPPAAYGGVEAVVTDLVDGLITAGHKVILVGGGGKNGTMAEMVPVWPRAVPDRLGDPEVEATHAMLTRRAVERLIDVRDVDVVHDHTFAGPLNASAYARRGVPTVVTTHGPVHDRHRRYYRDLGFDAGLVSISRAQRALAPELNWIGTVYNGLSPSEWPYQVAKEDYVLFLGRYHPNKGAHLAILAAHEAGLPIVLAGKRQEQAEWDYFENAVKPLLRPGDEAMDIAGAALKRELMAKARCMVFPVQWQEPFGMVMIESMVCGTPVVALRNGSVPEVIESGVTGFVCDEPSELAPAIDAVPMLDPAACRKRVVENFDVAAMVRGYTSIYDRAYNDAAALKAAANVVDEPAVTAGMR